MAVAAATPSCAAGAKPAQGPMPLPVSASASAHPSVAGAAAAASAAGSLTAQFARSSSINAAARCALDSSASTLACTSAGASDHSSWGSSSSSNLKGQSNVCSGSSGNGGSDVYGEHYTELYEDALVALVTLAAVPGGERPDLGTLSGVLDGMMAGWRAAAQDEGLLLVRWSARQYMLVALGEQDAGEKGRGHRGLLHRL